MIGLVTGYAASWVIGLTSDRLIELTITVVLAYGSYILADQFRLSGVIATVTAGIVLGNAGRGRTLSADGQDAIDTVWEFFAYLLTAVVFLLVGLAIPPMRLLNSLGPIAWAIVAVIVGRAIVVYVLLGGASRIWRGPGFGERLPSAWLHVIFWAGLRGAVAVAMALALPADIPQRDELQEITFGVVLFTLLVQGTTIGQLIDRTVRARRPAKWHHWRDRRPPRPKPRQVRRLRPSGAGTGRGAPRPPCRRSCAGRWPAGDGRPPRGTSVRWASDRAIRCTRCPCARSRPATSLRSDQS